MSRPPGGPGGGPAQRDDELAATYRTPAGCDDFDEERAAIIEFDGGVPRPWAEAFARLEPRRGVQQASCAAQLEPDRREECQSAPKQDPGLARNPNPVERL